MDARVAVARISPLVRPLEDSRFFNRELSWLEFNLRVLHEALDERTPLLERVFFLGIFNSNLDEFVQKRVGGLKRQIAAGVMTRSPDGLSPGETLVAIREAILKMLDLQARCYRQDICPALAAEGIHLLKWDQLTDEEHDQADDYFRKTLFPVLTPLAVDPGHPFPFISNLSTSLGVRIRQPDQSSAESEFARIKVPKLLPRWVQIGGPRPTTVPTRVDRSSGTEPMRFVHVNEIIRNHLARLFEGMVIEKVMPFRVTRNADVLRDDDDDAEDLLELIEQELRNRRFAPVVRLEVGPDPDPEMVRYLAREMELKSTDVYQMPEELDFTDLEVIHGLNLPDLKHSPWTPAVPQRLRDDDADIFSLIRAGDVLVHHPYESFTTSVERFVRSAAKDPKVVAIKQTLYRTSGDSPFIPDLIRAAEAGKQVICLVELKARFDEERNINVAQALIKAGVHVVYGLVGLKTHTKVAMVVRHEPDGMRTYCHIGTGNYNSKTAGLYTDLGLLTCRSELVGDAIELFNYLTGRSLKRDFTHLLVAPINMRSRFSEMIEREIEHCREWNGRGADPDDPNRPRIVAKMNSLEDRELCQKLYEASQAGVKIDLIVRGFCCLRPGIENLSENISVVSVIGRFLEHSRIYYFHNGGQPECFIGSADWMYRNLNNRVECITPIEEPALRQRLIDVLDASLLDHLQAWELKPDGGYIQRQPPTDPDPEEAASPVCMGTQNYLMEMTRSSSVTPERRSLVL
ncbi:MAG: polyphosphate kinase 1 [Phycisphaeraceae bacterium]|nr:polyphosphate kinase 1 [Phycisphaeraceae bacterium]